ncbi:hypothetical protein [Paraglaciecola sp.]|uniref:hypothetical protein n=1 Tax=Paraglaciecola sp. TaxID=1920173 RepID=UPI003EF1F13D
MNKGHSIIVSIGVSALLSSSVAFANIELSKEQVKQQVVSSCELEAKTRYGQDSIKSIGKKSKWMKGLKGASVKMKVKPQAKRLTKYSCVLGLDNSITFYKS